MVILDEATSALNSEIEAVVQQALERLMANRMTFIITRRFGTQRQVNRIITLERGKIIK